MERQGAGRKTIGWRAMQQAGQETREWSEADGRSWKESGARNGAPRKGTKTDTHSWKNPLVGLLSLALQAPPSFLLALLSCITSPSR